MRQHFQGFALTVTYDTHPLGAKPKFRISLPQPAKRQVFKTCRFIFVFENHFKEPMFYKNKHKQKRNVVIFSYIAIGMVDAVILDLSL